MSSRSPSRLASAAALALALGCSGGTGTDAGPDRPNFLFVVWDTARADRLSLYGYERETTPRLDRWAEQARVYEDCLSTAPITVSSHAAMFTGLLPTESGASNAHQWLDEGHVTLAELLADAGYRTFAWAANPHVSREENFTQGFQTVRHPWDPDVADRAREIVEAKVRGDRSNELGERLSKGDVGGWTLKAAGELAEEELAAWLDAGDPDRPWFAFVNYMEAHRPLIPPRAYRQRFLDPAGVARSYEVDVSWIPMWAYTFGLEEIPGTDLELFASVYDAALAELDDLFGDLLERLEAAGHLEDTVVVLTSDHGEHLGEQHMLDHQFTVYDAVLRVPLVVRAPGSLEPGRDARPVTNHDLFPTLLELAGLPVDLPPRSGAHSLLSLPDERLRLAEFTAPFTKPFRQLRKRYPDWDDTPWRQSLRALTDGEHKLIRGSAGRRELYRVGDEDVERSAVDADALRELEVELDRIAGELRPAEGDEVPEKSPEHLEKLEGLGYAGDE